ncbi:protein of unknown function [Hyphomicrobium sp. MC1]|nr:protein of unknown function [Hyphomicrobium sp. MC1]
MLDALKHGAAGHVGQCPADDGDLDRLRLKSVEQRFTRRVHTAHGKAPVALNQRFETCTYDRILIGDRDLDLGRHSRNTLLNAWRRFPGVNEPASKLATPPDKTASLYVIVAVMDFQGKEGPQPLGIAPDYRNQKLREGRRKKPLRSDRVAPHAVSLRCCTIGL